MADARPDIEAEIRFLTTEEGGRRTPVKSGYRPPHDFDLKDGLIDARHDFVGTEWVEPGGSVTSQLTFLAPEFLAGRLRPGFEFCVCEASRIVGRGRITKIFNKALLESGEPKFRS